MINFLQRQSSHPAEQNSSPTKSEVVGQYVTCAYCGHPASVIAYASVLVKVYRFGCQPSGEFQNKVTCGICHRVFWACWTITKSEDLFDVLKRAIFG